MRPAYILGVVALLACASSLKTDVFLYFARL